MRSMHSRTATLLNYLGAVTVALSSAGCNVCSGPRNADAWPDSPVPVQTSLCHHYQVYQATSAWPYDNKCGYAVTFGPKGDLKHPADGYVLEADWGDVPPTAADCASSHTIGMAWGYRCDNADCTQGDWEQIGQWQTRPGYWNSISNKCYLSLGFTASGKDYSTVQVQVHTYRGSNPNEQQKRAKGRIYVYNNTGQCLSAPPHE